MTLRSEQAGPAPGKRERLQREARSAGRFALVGAAATATHALVAMTALRGLGLQPHLANVCGFLIAFAVSFYGHHVWSFAHTREAGSAGRRMLRFLFVALAGFALNSGVLTGWLSLTDWPESLGLLISIAVVPAASFLLARFWAFRPARTPRPGTVTRQKREAE